MNRFERREHHAVSAWWRSHKIPELCQTLHESVNGSHPVDDESGIAEHLKLCQETWETTGQTQYDVAVSILLATTLIEYHGEKIAILRERIGSDGT